MHWLIPSTRNVVPIIYGTAVVLCGLIVLMRLVAQRLRTRRWFIDQPHPRCATCGYILPSGASAICSECGNDVRISGLITRPTWFPISLVPLRILLALLAIPAALALADALRPMCPVGWRFHVSQMVFVEEARFAVQLEGRGRYFSREPTTLMIYRNDGRDYGNSNILMVHGTNVTGNWGSIRGVVAAQQSLDRSLLARFLAAAAPESSERAHSDGAIAIVESAARLRSGGFPRHYSWSPIFYTTYRLTGTAFLLFAITIYFVLLTVLFATAIVIRKYIRVACQHRWASEATRFSLDSTVRHA